MGELTGVDLHGPLIQIDGALLDELELILGGLCDTPPGDAACRHVPGLRSFIAKELDLSDQAPQLTLADTEGTPLATARWVNTKNATTLRLTPLATAEHGPGRAMRLTEAVPEVPGLMLLDRPPSLSTLQELSCTFPAGGLLLLVASSSMAARANYPRQVLELQAAADLVPSFRAAHLVIPEHCEQDRVIAALGAPVLRDLRELPCQRSDNVPNKAGYQHKQVSSASGTVIMFTGLSGSGKSTLARRVRELLQVRGRATVLLDGDDVRRFVSKGLSFSREDRETNVERIGWIGARVAEGGGIALCAPIAPFTATRQRVRELASQAGVNFFLVHVATPLSVCEARDRKGLYAKARAGQLKEFTGIDSPYEIPEDADLRLDLGVLDVEQAAVRVLELLA